MARQRHSQSESADESAMDNPSRSERTRKVALEAALKIIDRDGPGRLTLDAIAKEAGISKGGLMHQFPTKHAVLKALLERQIENFEAFFHQNLAKAEGRSANPQLLAQIATFRMASKQLNALAVAYIGVLAEEPELLARTRDLDARRIAAIKTEARDPQLALLRRAAAHGLAMRNILGVSSTTEEERAALFDRLLDDAQWEAFERPAKPKPSRAKNAAKPARKR
jgi:AcrR family transcriptional regulator